MNSLGESFEPGTDTLTPNMGKLLDYAADDALFAIWIAKFEAGRKVKSFKAILDFRDCYTCADFAGVRRFRGIDLAPLLLPFTNVLTEVVARAPSADLEKEVLEIIEDSRANYFSW